MKIREITLSVFELPQSVTAFDLHASGKERRRWAHSPSPRKIEHFQVMHVRTDCGLEGISTIGDGRFNIFPSDWLEQLRILAIGENSLAREHLLDKLTSAARRMFAPPSWFAPFDNCLWDIAGKAANLPVSQLVGGARTSAPAYTTIAADNLPALVDAAARAASEGWSILKDHFVGEGRQNAIWHKTLRKELPDLTLIHDAAFCDYSYAEAVYVGDCLQANAFRWFEEPLPDHALSDLVQLCNRLDIPIAGCEAFMDNHPLCEEWLKIGATDILRSNARHGTSALFRLASVAQAFGTTVELNGPGGLFGLMHAHLCCGFKATCYYEAFHNSARERLATEIGMLNPIVPENGMITAPSAPGWGAVWDTSYFEKVRIAEI